NSGDTVVINILKADSLFANYLTVNNAVITNLIATYINADSALIKLLTTQYIKSDSAYIKLLRADNAYIKNIFATYIKSDSAYIKLLRADSMFTNYLYAHSIKTDTITAGVGYINSLYVGGQNILQTISDSIANQAWLAKGNNATAANKLGTLNANDLHIVTNSIEHITLSNTTGNVGINTTTPLVALHVATTDGIAVPTGTTGQQPLGAPVGTMRYNTTLGTMEVFNGTCWQNTNTPPIGSSYVQWANVADPNSIYTCTVWVSSDIQSGEFLRATGGNANVSAGGLLTGTTQTDGVQDHTHNGSGTANGSGALTTTNAGTHNHNWGGNWSIDDSRVFTSDNGDGNGNTLSDGRFWWGGSGATGSTGTDYNIVGGTTVNGAHSHSGTTTTDGNHDHTQGSNSAGVFYSDPLPAELSTGLTSGGEFSDGGASGISRGGFATSIAGNHNHTFGTSVDGSHSHNVEHFAHRHWIKTRPTTTAPDHAHTLPDHAHTVSVSVGTMNSGNTNTETRPVNVAVKYWRRIS
ncbi:MAG: hypothetical protein H7331_04250, partial [Bacteroidia bacterium]|nr:hypothetical protein [Bacteroidia bacterium]